jgi:hypothetical protein
MEVADVFTTLPSALKRMKKKKKTLFFSIFGSISILKNHWLPAPLVPIDCCKCCGNYFR